MKIKPCILIIDDEANNFDVVQNFLGLIDYDIHYASGGIKGLERLDRLPVDIILLDVMMSDLNGIEVCQRIKASPKWKSIPIITITSLTDSVDLARCLAAGADDFISKPVTRLELQARIGSMMRIRAQYIKLQIAKEKADLALKAKADFLAIMSHEIRTPISGILGATQLLATTQLTAEQQKYMRTVEVSGEMLLAVVNDILDFSKIEADKLTLEQNSIALDTIIHDVCESISPQAKAKSLSIKYQIDPTLPNYILGDLIRLRQILFNLANNAIKFTEVGEVIISAQVSPEQLPENGTVEILFSVSDTGIGIAEDDIIKLFQAFTQASTSTTRKYGGTGLGLAICSRLIELMEGKIWIESKVGVGSTFYFTIIAKITDIAPDLSTQIIYTATQNTTQNLSLKILLAEDNLINQELAIAMFGKIGYQIKVVENGLEAILALEEQPYDLLFTDLSMPKMNGLKLAKFLTQNWADLGLSYPCPKIIAMTASVLEDDRQMCFDAGMDDYITKPIFMKVIQESIDKWGRYFSDISAEGSRSKPNDTESNGSIDPIAFEQLRSLNLELIHRFIELFIEKETPALIDQLRNGISQKNMEEVSYAAHAMKTSSSILGAIKLSDLLQEVEIKSLNNDLNDLDFLMDKIDFHYQLACQELVRLRKFY
jgi:signal transduction histidine kinase/HPt (histidine-containing phosphotransfer) domain-containing protein